MWQLYLFYGMMNSCFQFPDVALRMYLVDTLALTPSAYAFVTSMAAVPWALKPFVGAVVDCNPYRKASLLVCGMGISLPWAVLASGAVTGPAGISALIIVSSASLCYADVTADALLVPFVRQESTDDMGKLQASCWMARACGAVLSGLAGGGIVYVMHPRKALYIMTALGLPTCLCIYNLATDVPVPSWRTVKNRGRKVVQTLKGDKLFRPCIFIFALCAMPSYGATLMVFFQTELRFTPLEFSSIGTAGHFAHGLGAFIYRNKFRFTAFSTIFRGGICIDIVLQLIMMTLILRVNNVAHIPDLALALCETISTAVISQVMMMPICLLAARTCPKNIEGTLYSTIMAISNLGGLCAMWMGAWFTDLFDIHVQHFQKLWQLALLCLLSSFIPLTCVNFMKNDPRELAPAEDDNGEIELTPCADHTSTCNPVSDEAVASEVSAAAGSPTRPLHTGHVDE